MHIPLSTTNYEDLINNGLWIVIDAWATQPHKDVEMITSIQLNHYNYIFLGHLKEELMKTHVYREDKIVQIECKNIINFMQSDEATLDHRFEQFAHVDNQEDLISYILDRDAKDIIICGLHYGKCITTAAMILEDAINIGIEEAEPVLAGRNLYIKRDMCCLWPDDEISQHDRVYKQMQLELI